MDNVPDSRNKGETEKVELVNGVSIAVNDLGGITSWVCRDYIDEGRILIETGFYNDPKSVGFGFVLFDGSDSGTFTSHGRDGINHRWNWGPNGNSYAFIIKPDGTGLYYEFMGKKTAEKASDIFKCKPR